MSVLKSIRPKQSNVTGTIFGVFLGLLIASVPAVAWGADIPNLETPILYTSLGQSPDAKTFSVLAKRAHLEGTFSPLATAEEIAAAKTIFVTVGTSLKGFGSAGVNLDTESARSDEIIAGAEAAGAYLILVHIGGEGRRDSMTNLLLEKLAPSADAFIVYDKGNGDGFFSEAAGEKPLVLVPKTLDVVQILESLGS